MKAWFTKWAVAFVGFFPLCMAALSQTNWRPIKDIPTAALESDKNFQRTWQGTKPPSFEYGEYEIPSQYWTEAIKELKPVKVYDHSLNVAIVLSIRDGVEEGIYISNPISSEMAFVGPVRADGFEFRYVPGDWLHFRKHKPPRFEDYLVSSVYRDTPASPKIVASSDEQDMKKIRNGVQEGVGVFHGSEEKKGPNFAGHFILIQWSCGSPCLGMAIVDEKNGDVFSPPGTSNCVASFHLPNLTYPGQVPQNPELQFRLDSNLLITKNNDPAGLPYTFYYLWQENRWTLLRRVPLQKIE